MGITTTECLPVAEQARIKLYVALIQCCAADDRLIRQYMREAYALLGGDLTDLDRRNPGGAL